MALHEVDAQYRRALGRNPSDIWLRFRYTLFLLAESQDDGAIERQLQFCRESLPDDADLFNKLALALANRGKLDDAQRFFEQALQHHQPPAQGGRSVRLYYITQASARPPTFMVSSNFPDRVHFSYQRYLVNQLRKRFGFEGTPIRVFYRKRGSA